VAKIMTAYLTLLDHPLKAGQRPGRRYQQRVSGVPVGAGAGDVEDEAVALAGGVDGDVAQDCAAAGDLPGGHVRSAGSARRAVGEPLARAEPHRKQDMAVGALAVVEGDRPVVSLRTLTTL